MGIEFRVVVRMDSRGRVVVPSWVRERLPCPARYVMSGRVVGSTIFLTLHPMPGE